MRAAAKAESFRCTLCGAVFREPRVSRIRQHHGEFVETLYESLCPRCGCQEIEEAAPCPKCGEYMSKEDILCPDCRRDLADRFRDFADHLTAEEEEQLDAWLDGVSILERENFS